MRGRGEGVPYVAAGEQHADDCVRRLMYFRNLAHRVNVPIELIAAMPVRARKELTDLAFLNRDSMVVWEHWYEHL